MPGARYHGGSLTLGDTMRSRPLELLWGTVIVCAAATSCSADVGNVFTSGAGPGGGTAEGTGTGTASAQGGSTGQTVTAAGGDGGGAQGSGGDPTSSQGGGTTTGSAGGDGGSGGGTVDICAVGCGNVELCSGIHQGLDDNCNGTVDEGCACTSGQASSCFKGNPSYIDLQGCAPGTMSCTAQSTWGPCQGGEHATPPDNCQLSAALGCRPIDGVPFQATDLRSGTGTFDDNADTESFAVACPAGVTPCAVPTGASYQALQSGEYTVTYTKVVGGVTTSCEYPLSIGARGLNVELSWTFAATSNDLDLHAHEPMTVTPWKLTGGTQDCGWSNCKAADYLPSPVATAPQWFPIGNVPPNPVNWYDAPTNAGDLCYFAPRGQGAAWLAGAQGCHSPRLDLDNISCNPTITDPSSASFCAPEAISIDFPPNDQWIRVAVHYYSGSGLIEPHVRIFCHGELAGELGPSGFYNPETPLVWNGVSDAKKVWMAADVVFKEDACSKTCKVSPIYVNGDVVSKLPYIVTDVQAEAAFAPAYPPIPL